MVGNGPIHFRNSFGVVESCYGGANELYRNDGSGTFARVTGSAISSLIGSVYTNTRAVAWGDMDGDGDLVKRRRALSVLCCSCVFARPLPSMREMGCALCTRHRIWWWAQPSAAIR